jgi:hypothetical protein
LASDEILNDGAQVLTGTKGSSRFHVDTAWADGGRALEEYAMKKLGRAGMVWVYKGSVPGGQSGNPRA